MDQFVIPQFIDVEDKIIGPVTTRQFIIMLAAGLLIFIFYKIFAFSVFVIIAVLLIGAGGTLAFVRINGQPFHFFFLNLIQTFKSPNLQIWNKEVSEDILRASLKEVELPHKMPTPRKAPLRQSRLSEISLLVDTGGVYEPEP